VAVDKPGNKLVEVFYKRNIDENKDNSLDYWTLASSQEVEVTESNQQVEILIKDIIMKRNDNVGIYIRTKDISNTTLSKNK
jgi:hypothetical protein